MTNITAQNIYDFINSIAPYNTQESWDNAGCLIGSLNKPVSKVVLALDGTKNVAKYASETGADLLLTHHPLIFSPLKKIMTDDAIYTLISNDITCISSHTNFDKSTVGINFNLATLLKLQDQKQISDFIVCGALENPTNINDFADFVKNKLDVSGIRYTNNGAQVIKNVAVGGGSIGDTPVDELKKICDVLVTGDLKYHQFLEADEMNFNIISAGHYETENEPFLMLISLLEKQFPTVNFTIAPRSNPVKSL